MPPRVKITLSILIAILLVGAGYFFIVNKPKPEVLPSVNISPKTEEVDTSGWQTYRNETLGFEIKMPKDMGADDPQIGPQPNLESEFWRDQVGGVWFLKNKVGFPQFNVRVKDSDLTLEEFARKVGVSKGENNLINNLSAKKAPGEDVEAILIKGDKRYYYFEFVVSVNNPINDFILWNQIISTFKPLD